MTDQQPNDPLQKFMDHITEHQCDRIHCKTAQRLAFRALLAREQDWGFPYTEDPSKEAKRR